MAMQLRHTSPRQGAFGRAAEAGPARYTAERQASAPPTATYVSGTSCNCHPTLVNACVDSASVIGVVKVSKIAWLSATCQARMSCVGLLRLCKSCSLQATLQFNLFKFSS